MNFEFKTLFEIPLSSSIADKGKTIKKFVKVQQGQVINKRNDIDLSYHINRLEIRNDVSGNTPIGISLNNTDFYWFMKCIKLKSEKSVHVGNKTLTYMDLGDTSVNLATLDRDRSFGVVLSARDINIIIANEGVLGFLLKNQNLKGDNLKDITFDIYTSVIAKYMKLEIQKRCSGCQNSNEQHNCKTEIRHIPEIKDILISLINDSKVDGEFNEKFVRLMDLMNVKPPERLTQTQLYIPDLKSDIEFIIRRLTFYIDEKERNKDLQKVLELCAA